jgi:hypothetical protein
VPTPTLLKQIGHIHRHLLNRSVVESLDLTKGPHVIVRHEIDGLDFVIWWTIAVQNAATLQTMKNRLEHVRQELKKIIGGARGRNS